MIDSRTFYNFAAAPLYIGYHGENLVTGVDIDIAGVLPDGWGAGLLLRRPGESDAYPATSTLVGKLLRVVYSTADSAIEGRGEATIQLMGGNGEIKKSATAQTIVEHALDISGDPPEPVEQWLEQMEKRLIPPGGTTGQVLTKLGDADNNVGWEDPQGGGKPYLSLERVSRYLYNVSFANAPDVDADFVPAGGCSAYVQGGKLYRNLDWSYDHEATFHVKLPGIEGLAFMAGLTDTELDDDLIAQLPYRMVDGVNEHGIMVSAHVLYNDWTWSGTGNIPLTRLPYLALSRVKSMATVETDLADVLDDLKSTPALDELEYLIQVLVTDGETSCVLSPTTDDPSIYEIIDVTDNPKLSNFRWVEDATVARADLQNRPTGVERWNMMPCPLEELRFTKAYEEPTRLSEFIGLRGTTKDSTDEELMELYEAAHDLYEERTRDGSTWQTMHSVVYSAKGMEHLYIQEDWSRDMATSGSIDHRDLEHRDADDQHPISAITGLEDVLDAKADLINGKVPASQLPEVEDEIVYFEYGVATYEEVKAAYDAGKTIYTYLDDLGLRLFIPLLAVTENSFKFIILYTDELSPEAIGFTAELTAESGWGDPTPFYDLSDILSDLSQVISDVDLIRNVIPDDAASDNQLVTESGLHDAVGEVGRSLLQIIPADTSPSNKLVNQQTMGDAIEAVEAKQIYKTSAQGSFATKAELLAATTFYNADGTVATPTKNDVAYVLADETHDGKSAKYTIASVANDVITWGFVITFSNTAFSQAQMDAINSGATAAKIGEIDDKIDKTAQAAKTADMTQPVGIDEDGKLFVPPASNVIDDTAGDGDTDKTWSADKLTADLDAKADASDVLPRPASGLAVGKMFKIASYDATTGALTLEAVDASSGIQGVKTAGTELTPDADGKVNIPFAGSSAGIIKIGAATTRGISVTNGEIGLVLTGIGQKIRFESRSTATGAYPITISCMDLALKYAMTDGRGAAWTDKEKTGAWKRLNSIKSTMDSVAVAGAQYYLGVQSAVSIIMPTDAELGQEIKVFFKSGSTAATLTCDLDGFDYTPKANTAVLLTFRLVHKADAQVTGDEAEWTVQVEEG